MKNNSEISSEINIKYTKKKDRFKKKKKIKGLIKVTPATITA